ncbi:adhesion molecule [Chlorella sorokiniana]|uniref:Adhesion molecule n=1 Tax=Chlorella sorokiniana TaxID=3076 RepID=A0A2P6TGS3_CHLSO|nr:adhesion molecule [Chlorella sorokiniana]|eukprot:PRW33310.1 adhesion molecule [Chlorella sorokiniana]
MDVIVEFRVGLMSLADGRLVADPRKGVLRVCQDEAGLSHLCWHERDAAGATAAEPAVDLVIIPGESTFSKIGGRRVFELRFPEEKERNMFFWAQEPSADEDETYVAAVHAALNSEEADTMDAEGPAAPAAPAAAPAAAAPAAAAGGGVAASGAASISASNLAAALGSILSGAAARQAGMAAMADPGPSLGDVLKPEALGPLLASDDMVARLAPYLPEEHRSAAAIRELVSTPQFRHQLDLFSHALMTGQLDTSQFGLPAGGFGVLDFLRSIQTQADQKKGGEGQQQQQAQQQ